MIYEFHGCIKIETCIQKRGEDGSSKFKFYNNFADTFSFSVFCFSCMKRITFHLSSI